LFVNCSYFSKLPNWYWACGPNSFMLAANIFQKRCHLGLHLVAQLHQEKSPIFYYSHASQTLFNIFNIGHVLTSPSQHHAFNAFCFMWASICYVHPNIFANTSNDLA